MRRTVALVLLLGLLGIAACGDDSEPVDTGQEPGGSPEVAIRVSVGGGFVPRGADFMSVPTVVLSDGKVFAPGAMTLQYPGPPVLPVLTGTLPSAEVDGLLAAARAAGLDRDDVDYGRPNVSDAGTTTITVVLDGEEHVTEVYALGLDGPTGPGDGQDMSGLTDEQREARAVVDEFVTAVADQVDPAATATFDPTGYQVLSFESEPASSFTDEPRPNELAWPASIPSSGLGRSGCFELSGDHAAAFTAALADATSITVWRDPSGATWQLAVRATVPGDDPCPVDVAEGT